MESEGGGGTLKLLPVCLVALAAVMANAKPLCEDERLEKTLDAKYLVRTNGLYYLNLARDWRIGASAHRIMALAFANGSRFRDL